MSNSGGRVSYGMALQLVSLNRFDKVPLFSPNLSGSPVFGELLDRFDRLGTIFFRTPPLEQVVSTYDLFHDPAVFHAGKFLIETLELKRQFGVIDSQ